MKVKEWFINKVRTAASKYNIYLDFTYEKDGWVKLSIADVLEETEKAIKVEINSSISVGSFSNWTTWIPKSVIDIDERTRKIIDEVLAEHVA